MAPYHSTLSSGDFDSFVRGSLSCPERRRIVVHLLHGCPDCSAALARHAGFVSEAESDWNYEPAFQRALARAREIVEARREADAVLGTLLAGETAPNAAVATARARECRGVQQVAALLQAGHAHRHSNPGTMVRLAYLGCCAAERLSMPAYGATTVADIRGLAWAELGNAYRVAGDLDDAARALESAVYWKRRGSGSPRLQARLSVLMASLRIDQRRFVPARDHLAEAYDIYAAAGDQHLAGRTLISAAHLAIAEAASGASEEALLLFGRGLDLIDHKRDPQLVAQSLRSMIECLVSRGQVRVARRQLWRVRALLTMYADRLDLLRLRWLEAKIHAGLGDFKRAETAFQETCSGFAAAGQICASALAGLELAALWADQGRVEEIGAIAGELVAAFRTLGIAREAIATLLVLQRACALGVRVADLIEAATAVLRELQHQPARLLPG